MSTAGPSSDGLLDRRDREVLRAASPAYASSAGSSPRRRWSPKSSGGHSSPGVPRSRWSPVRWSPSRLSPSSLRRRKKYQELQVQTNGSSDDEEGDDIPNFKENASPITELSMDGIPVPSLGSLRPHYESPLSGPSSIPSPAAAPRFSLKTLRRRDSHPPNPSPASSSQHQSQGFQESKRGSQSSSQSTTPLECGPLPVFRFKLHTLPDGTEAVLPRRVEVSPQNKEEQDDFDQFLKERQTSSILHKPTSPQAPESIPKTGVTASEIDLHTLCAGMSTWDDVFRAKNFLTGHIDHASKLDTQGRTPLHVLSSNKILATAVGVPHELDLETREYLQIFEQPTTEPSESTLEKHLIRFLVGDLLPANPSAMMIRDNNGQIPFEAVLGQWVTESHQRSVSNDSQQQTGNSTGFSYSTAMGHVWESTMKMAGCSAVAGNTSPQAGSLLRTDLERGSVSRSPTFSPKGHKNESRGIEDELKDKAFPSFIRLTPQARFALTMLSLVVDQLERYISLDISPRNLQRTGRDADKDNFARAQKGLREFQERYGSVNIVLSVVQVVAAVPDLMKTILLIENDDDRNFALSTSIMRRVMINKYSIGPWLTQVLQSRDKRLAQRAVDYLKTVSIELCKEFPGPSSNLHSTMSVEPTRNSQFIDAVSRLQGFIPSLLALNDRGIEDASTTFIVKKVLGKMISRPFAVTVILFDAVFLALLIVGFRTSVNRTLEGAPLDNILQWIYVANFGIFYFIIREIGKTVSLFLISKRARIYFFSFWNAIDLLAIVLALASTIAMRFHFTILENGLENISFLRGLLAIATGFLWLRVLSLLKAINMQLATFVLAILQITKDIMWFCVILLTLVISFSQMFFTLMAPPTCATGEGSDFDCKPTEYLLRVYTMLLGDFGNFERDQLTNAFSVALAVFFSFLVTVVLLNVLIAVASDSYEKCLLRSQYLFGRARVMLVAELVSFQTLLKMSENYTETATGQDLYSRWWFSGRFSRNWSRGSLLFLSISTVVIIGWSAAELLGYAEQERHSNIIFSLASVVVNVVLFAIIMVFLSSASTKVDSPDGRNNTPDWFFQRAMLRILSTSTTTDMLRGNDDSEWNGRVHYLKSEMKRIADEQKLQSKQQAKAMEALVNQTEFRVKAELEVMEDNFMNIRSALVDEVRISRRLNQQVQIAIEELRHLITIASSSVHRSPVPSEVDVDHTRILRHGQRDI